MKMEIALYPCYNFCLPTKIAFSIIFRVVNLSTGSLIHSVLCRHFFVCLAIFFPIIADCLMSQKNVVLSQPLPNVCKLFPDIINNLTRRPRLYAFVSWNSL